MSYNNEESGTHRIEIDLKNLKEETKMGEAINVFTPGGDSGMGGMLPAAMAMAGMGNRTDGGMGSGLGAGLIGGLLGGVLFGGAGFGRRDGIVDGCRDKGCLDGTDGMAIMGGIGSIKDTIGASTMGLTNALMEGFAMQSTNTLQQTIMLGNIASANQLMTTQGLNLINQNVSDQGCRTRETVAMDGNATRALITQLNTDNLNRLLTVADLDRRDECSRARSREVEVNVTQTVNQVQLQAQQQQQQQGILFTLSKLCDAVGNVTQIARATNENVIVGNTGATTTGAQTASPTNVNTR